MERHPVLTREYAVQMARDWNAKDRASGYSGFVTRFSVDSEFLARYSAHQVGNSIHREYWIPAQELPSDPFCCRGFARPRGRACRRCVIAGA